MVKYSELGTCSYFPPSHSRSHFSTPVFASGTEWNNAADFFETLSPEELCRTRNRKDPVASAACEHTASVLMNEPTCDSQLRIVHEEFEQLAVVIRVKRRVRI
jgi:hypothetical protein